MAFKPGKTLSISVVVCLAILIGLGTWQARKVGPKTEMIEQIEAGLGAAEALLASDSNAAMAQAYKPVQFDGVLLRGEARRVYGMNANGKPGYHLYSAVLRQNAPAVIVAVGWVPFDDERKIETGGEAWTSFTGVAMPTALPGAMTPDNNPNSGEWFLADVDQLAASMELASYLPVRVILNRPDVLRDDIEPSYMRMDIPNNHFQYMLTWYGLALSLVCVYVAFGFKQGRGKQE